ncbi:beta-galactosidase [Rubrimonas sp.]|uniref:beta-galactosidase n=1 Tax=Rubrimonas sp. TaxID=2036015 RepID=UPI002FDE017F
MSRALPQVPFGAVYFRKSNPPRDDWARDYAQAAADGLNVFRHWFMWSAIERAPGRYDWSDYDRQLDLAAEHGIGTIIAELIHAAPDWGLRRFADGRVLRADGRPLPSIMGVSAATGGFAANGGGAGTLTLNCPAVREAAGAFLTALAERYRGHPGLIGYDVWNECNYAPNVDFNPHTKGAFRHWLREKYGDLDALAVAWNRYSYAEWEDVEPPSQTAPYPECIDWTDFKRDNFYGQMQWRIDTIRAVDSDALIAAHGVAGAITDMAARGCDDWLAASKVQLYGYTWIQARKGAQPWRNIFGADLVRGASRGKPFWHAERQGGPLWMQPQVLGRDKEDGRVAEPEDLRLWCLTSFAGGAKGMMNLRFRPLLDGPLFGAFGSYGLDGAPTPRSEMAAAIARWANDPEQAGLFAVNPVRGDVGLVVCPETQTFDRLLSHEGGFDTYAASMWGAYRGFLDNGAQPDWVHIDDIADYAALYFPYPIMLPERRAKALADWVEAGGALICEACPGYFGDRGRVWQTQPGAGLDRLFGARETEAEFMPDIGDRVRFLFDGLTVTGGGFLQAYEPAGGTIRGRFTDGRVAVVEHRHGEGRTLLVGTQPACTYHHRENEDGRRWFSTCLDWLAPARRVRCANPTVLARLHEGDGQRCLWLVNPTRSAQSGAVLVDGAVPERASGRWIGESGSWEDGRFVVPPRDALVLQWSQ